jgi:hypothetical protein
MNKKTFFGAMAVVTAVALTGSALVASNMGFKLNYSLTKASVGTSKTGTNTLALPDNRQAGLNTSKNLMDDIGFANVLSVQKFLEATDGLQVYTGAKGGQPDFNLTAGDGVFVRMLADVPYIVVGSDDPALAYALNQAQVGVSKSGTNFFAYNYHQTAATSKTLMDDIGFASVLSVQKFLKATDGLQVYTGAKGGQPDFALVPGEAYFVRMAATVNYTPSHY